MNYLAHAYLSFNEPEILTGNMISDFVKGKKKYNYLPGIQNGIKLHRAIDEFTDTHAATQKAKKFFKPAYRLYAGAFVDVVYDHFLACDIDIFSDEQALNNFTRQVYKTLQGHFSIMPDRFQKMFYYMKAQNWLYNYQFKWGIEKSFQGLVHRAIYLHESAIAYSIFKANYMDLKICYQEFFPDQKLFAAHQLSNLLPA